MRDGVALLVMFFTSAPVLVHGLTNNKHDEVAKKPRLALEQKQQAALDYTLSASTTMMRWQTFFWRLCALDLRRTRCIVFLALRCGRLSADSLHSSFWRLAALDFRRTRCRLFRGSLHPTFVGLAAFGQAWQAMAGHCRPWPATCHGLPWPAMA